MQEQRHCHCTSPLSRATHQLSVPLPCTSSTTSLKALLYSARNRLRQRRPCGTNQPYLMPAQPLPGPVRKHLSQDARWANPSLTMRRRREWDAYQTTSLRRPPSRRQLRPPGPYHLLCNTQFSVCTGPGEGSRRYVLVAVGWDTARTRAWRR